MPRASRRTSRNLQAGLEGLPPEEAVPYLLKSLHYSLRQVVDEAFEGRQQCGANGEPGGADVGEAACTASACLVVSGATTANGDILAYVGANSSPTVILQTDKNEFEPAILQP